MEEVAQNILFLTSPNTCSMNPTLTVTNINTYMQYVSL